MTRLPTVGSDVATWGTVLNQFLQVGHNAAGSNANVLSAVNVKDDAYGAKGDGSTDDTVAIQAAITAVSATGGIVFFPPGTYIVSNALTVNSYIVFAGAGDHATNISMSSVTNKDCFSGVDVSNVSFRDLTLTGPGSGSGKGINFTRSSNPATAYIACSNLKILNWGSDGAAISNPIVSTFSRIITQTNGGYGLNLYGVVSGASGTSCSLDACYGNADTLAGIRLYNMTYCALQACAVDSNPVGYLIDACSGIALSGCGGEANTTNTFKITGSSTGITLMSPWTYDSHGDAIYVTGNSTSIALIGCIENSPHAGATSFIKVDAGSLVTLINSKNITANSLAASTTTTLTDASGSTQILGLTVYGGAGFQGNTGFNSTTPISKPTVSGSKGGNAALASLMTALANYGLVTDTTT